MQIIGLSTVLRIQHVPGREQFGGGPGLEYASWRTSQRNHTDLALLGSNFRAALNFADAFDALNIPEGFEP